MVRYAGHWAFLSIENVEVLSNEGLDSRFPTVQFIENMGISLHMVDILRLVPPEISYHQNGSQYFSNSVISWRSNVSVIQVIRF